MQTVAVFSPENLLSLSLSLDFALFANSVKSCSCCQKCRLVRSSELFGSAMWQPLELSLKLSLLFTTSRARDTHHLPRYEATLAVVDAAAAAAPAAVEATTTSTMH